MTRKIFPIKLIENHAFFSRIVDDVVVVFGVVIGRRLMMLVCFSSINFLELVVSVSMLSFITAGDAKANGEMAIWNNPIIVNIHTITMKEEKLMVLLVFFSADGSRREIMERDDHARRSIATKCSRRMMVCLSISQTLKVSLLLQ